MSRNKTIAPKKNDIRQCECGKKAEHLGYRAHSTLTSVGEIKVERLYCGCSCGLKMHPTDGILGIDGRYTVGLRDLAVHAAADDAFAKAEERLKKFCGIEISENTIKMLCDKEAVKIETWQKTDPLCTRDFQASNGELEFTTDGTMVNTLNGWREFRVGIFSVRILGPSATPDQWGNRHLPQPHYTVAFAAMEDKDTFRARWGSWANRLKITKKLADMSTLGDGAYWIWDACMLEFGKTRENLDIYHALEYLSGKGDLLYGKETQESKIWFETVKWDLLNIGVAAVLQRVRLRQTVEPLAQHQKTLKTLENYLIFHSERMNYRQRLFEGRSIGSGQVEGACKNLIGARMKQTGARWSEARVARMGVICALRYSDQWNDYWKQAN